MRIITIQIADKFYGQLKEFLQRLPASSFRIHENDPNYLLEEEQEEYSRLKKSLDKGDFSDFEEWDSVKDKL